MENGFTIRPIEQSQKASPMPPGGSVRALRFEGIWRAVACTGSWLKSERPKRCAARALGIVGISVALYMVWIFLSLPDISDPRTLIAAQSSVITDRNGVELYRLFAEEDRTYVAIADVPDSLEHAFVAIEDERFYDRGCMDFRALARAVLRLGTSGGGSTITRQLARNALELKKENIITRKLKELILGCSLEWSYDKEKLLELYLNWIPFGQNAYGVEQASQRYFGKGVKDLSLAESAVLASLPQRPSYFSPYGTHTHTTVTEDVRLQVAAGEITDARDINADDVTVGLLGNWIGTPLRSSGAQLVPSGVEGAGQAGSLRIYIGGRTDQVLRKMEDLAFIEERDRLAALEETEHITFQPARENIRAPHFVLWIRDLVEGMLGDAEGQDVLSAGGLTITTTLDWGIQQAADTVVEKHREDMASRFNGNNIALVALQPETREILAYVGNADYDDEERDGKVDMVRSPRQPGSSFKPIVYAAAFEEGYGPATVLYDVPTTIGDDKPQNFDGTFLGLLSARQALGASRNIPATKAFFLAGGEEKVLAMASRLGASVPRVMRDTLRADRGGNFAYGWPLALGSGETPLMEMVNAYATLGNAGVYRDPVALLSIRDSRGNVVPCQLCRPDSALSAEGLAKAEPALDPRIAYQVTAMLSDIQARPNAYWQQVLSVPGFAAAAKTGTSNKCLERTTEENCKVLRPYDLWTLGYTPNLAAGVWLGNANSESLYEKAESLSTAAPIWHDFMTRAHKLIENPKTAFPVPEGLVQLQVSGFSGELPTECTPLEWRRTELFLEERVPTEPDPACSRLMVDKVTGLLASDTCPAEAREERSFLVPRSIAAERWPLWEQGVQEWAMKQMEIWNATESHTGSVLPLPIAPTKECDPSLTPGRLVKPKVDIEFPSGSETPSYPSFVPKIGTTVGSEIREIHFTVDGKLVGSTMEPPFKVTIRVPRSVSKDGTHVLEVTIIDEYYNQAKDSAIFSFGEDRGGPRVDLTMPEDGASFTTKDTLHIAASAEDAQGGIKYVEFYLDDTLLTTRPQEPYMVEYPLKGVSLGSHTVRARATDLAGNEEEDSVMVRVGG